MIIDTHAHLDYPDFAQDFDDVLARAREAGVTRIVTIATSLESSRRVIGLAERHPEVFAVVGVHPTDLPETDTDLSAPLRELAAHPRVVAIGETGLDYHRLPGADLRKGASQVSEALGAGDSNQTMAEIMDESCKARQALFFQTQLDVAAEVGLNVVIHQRDAWTDTLELLEPYHDKVRCVFHCFGNSPEQMSEVIRRGHLVSFTGVVTFKNGRNVREVAEQVPENAFMLETDCPYLAPEPFRGQRCEPAHTRQVAAAIAAVRNRPIEEIAQITTANAEAFFRFPKS